MKSNRLQQCFLKMIIMLFLMSPPFVFSQESTHEKAVGFNYGEGHGFKSKDYTFTNRYVKGQLLYVLNKPKKGEVKYSVLIQPEVNFATHQLLNPYFILPTESNYQEKIKEFTQLKDIREYVLGVGFVIEKPLMKSLSVYVIVSSGPMITDTETERLSKGFAFSDVLSVGVKLHYEKVIWDIRPSVRHSSNLNFQSSNAGINTMNIETGIAFLL